MANVKRFALGKPDGLHSSIWRFWTQKNDIYIAVRSIGGDVKTSLHESGDCQTSFTYPFFVRMREFCLLTPKQPRHIRKWHAHATNGKCHLLDIVIPHENLKQSSIDKKTMDKVDWISPLSDFKRTQFTIYKYDSLPRENMWWGKDTMNTLLYHRCKLMDGWHVDIVYFGQNTYLSKTDIEVSKEYKQPQYAAVRVGISPENGVGYLVDSFQI